MPHPALACPALARPAPLALIALIGFLLSGCAATPPVAPSPPPQAVAAALDRYLDQDVTWGGMVIETRNFEHHSEIEMLAFPLDRYRQPLPHALDLGRFVLLRAGFLDPQVFSPGRFVTATGRITGDRQGDLRGVPLVWPELDAHELELWPAGSSPSRVRFNIGIGIGVRL
jgi:outer membrane lipoprotein